MDSPAWRSDFPALAQDVHGQPLAYLDSAATSLKPHAVIDAVVATYHYDAGSVHRGVHLLSERATAAFEGARADIAAWLGAPAREIVLTHGTTESLNLVARGWARPRLRAGTAVVVSALEHHANLVPWQEVCAETGAELRIAPIDDAGAIDLARLAKLLDGAQVVAVTHLSNVLGTVAPIARISELAHRAGAVVVVDGAQAAAHLPIDVGVLGCDFYALSSHKVYGPGGAGALWGRAELLADTAPLITGGGMVASVSYQHASYREPPARFEAGTPDIASVIGFGAAIRYLRRIAMEARGHEASLHKELVGSLGELPFVRVLGRPDTALASFVVDGVHAHDIATVLDRSGVAVRSGHHCAQPLHDRLGVTASVRASLGMYSNADDVRALVAGLHRVREVFG